MIRKTTSFKEIIVRRKLLGRPEYSYTRARTIYWLLFIPIFVPDEAVNVTHY